MRKVSATLVVAAMLVAGCSSTVGGSGSPDPTPGGPGSSTSTAPQPPAKGSQVLTWSQEYISEVGPYAEAHPTPVLLRTTQEWAAWVAGLPAAVVESEPASALNLDLTDAVVVAGSFPSCKEQSRVIDHGSGEVSFDVFVAPEDLGTVCAWSPYRIDVWLVSVEQLGVPSAADVTLVR